jgi:SAM-dependent MidA family methyltransferase
MASMSAKPSALVDRPSTTFLSLSDMSPPTRVVPEGKVADGPLVLPHDGQVGRCVRVTLRQMTTFEPAGTPPSGSAAGPADRWAESDAALVERLRARILRDGPLRFDRFMASALYDPQGGYYATDDRRSTRTGDYLSAPELDPIFGATLAAQVEEVWSRLGQPETFTLREDAAGSGALGVAILDRLVAAGSPLASVMRYLPVEVDAGREAGVRARVIAAGHEARLAEPGRQGQPVTGVIIANELLDALPVRRLTRRDGRLLELHVDWHDDWFAEAALPPSDQVAGEALAREGIELVEGQVAEVGLAAAAWVRDLGARLESGLALIIDYGHSAADLYDPAQRLGGLLRTYRGHHVGDDPYRSVGRQDLTAHVDWTAIELAATDGGLTVIGRTSQAEALTGLGVGDRLVELGARAETTPAAYAAARAAVVRLVDPRAMGGFGVLALGRGMALEAPLACLAFRLPPRPR